MTEERRLQAWAVSEINKRRGPHIYAEVRHGNAMTTAGRADISISCAGLRGELELKGPKGKATPMQLHMAKTMLKAGVPTCVASTRQQVLTFIEHLERKAIGLKLLDSKDIER